MSSQAYDVIVLGAGIAGLTATRALSEAGKRVLLLEGKPHVGGRMLTHHVSGLAQPIELGAEFIHGRPPELLALLEEAGLETYEGQGEQLCFLDGALQSCPHDEEAWKLLDGMQAIADRDGDMSFEQYLARSTASDEDKARARNYVEGFNAADANVIGIRGLARQQAAEDAIEGDRVARVALGYKALADYVRDRALAGGATLLFETAVNRVEWQPGHCTVHAEGGRQWSARQVLCALPLGVLQASSVQFEPMPERTLQAAQSLRAGAVQRLVLQFNDRFWAPAHRDMHFLFAQALSPSTYWTTAPRTSPLLTAWSGGPRALAVNSSDDLTRDALHSLQQIFARPVEPLLTAAHHHDWQADPYARGAYSYAPSGAADASAVLSQPVAQTLFFAGEHTDITGHPGTVHGALRSGLRAARQVLAAR